MPASAARPPRIYTVPAGRPFLACLARAILDGNLPAAGGAAPSPIELPDYALLMPTRRATRALQDAFLAAAGGRAMLLPRIRPISEGEEDLSLLTGLAGLSTLAADDEDIPPAVSEIERRLTLTELVLRWSQSMRAAEADPTGSLAAGPVAGSNTPAQAAQLAAELARLIDTTETENVSLTGLDQLVPDDYSEHWQKTLAFLRIVTEFWPIHLAERKFASPMDRRNRLILGEARRLIQAPPSHPVIVAGVTGSIPATTELIRAVASLDHGAIVLPNLDCDLDEPSWAEVTNHPEHPQFGLKKLLDTLGLTRADVAILPGAEPSGTRAARNRLLSETMRPAATTALWHGYTQAADRAAVTKALEGVERIDAPTAQDEAEVVALILREAVEAPGRTAALVSPDRLLARRVAIRLESWGIKVDDSAGRPFAKTVPGAFLNLVIDAVAEDFAPASVVALLKHPLCRVGLDPFPVRRAARTLELAAFRTVYLGRGIDGIEAALEKAAADSRDRTVRVHRAVGRLWQEDWDAARDLVARLKVAYAPLITAYANRTAQPLRTFSDAHARAAEAIARLPDPLAGADAPSSPLWQGEAGEAASNFFASLLDPDMPAPAIRAADYADLFRSLLAGEAVRPRGPVHPRLSIWGPTEARLQQPDVIVLGSLNDGTWPDSADPGAWLNRPMRARLGMPSPEEAIGRAAHDFISLTGASKVFLTRAEKMDGVPTVPSRWLMRLDALLVGMDLKDQLGGDTPWLGWARARDAIPRRIEIKAPEPRPPLDRRPRRMSVSDVETWIANPYAIYARHVLGLSPLTEIGAPPDASLRGSVIHEALAQFARAYPTTLPANPKDALMAHARQVLIAYTGNPRVAAFWLPRLERFAAWFADTEAERRSGAIAVHAEVQGALAVPAAGGPFQLTARADRIDEHATGLVITDYKTGAPPPDKRVKEGAAPQLPLEAAIAAETGFAGVEHRITTALKYIRASGGNPPGDERQVKADDVAALAAQCLAGLHRLIDRFDDPATPYAAVRRARFNYDYDDYAHLARIAEWSAGSAEEGNDEA